MENKFETWDDLPQHLKDELFKRHQHADWAAEKNPDQIVYTEESVIELVNYIINTFDFGTVIVKEHGK